MIDVVIGSVNSFVIVGFFFQPQLSSAQNGSAVTSDPASGSGSLGSGPLLESEDHQAMSNKPRFISVNSLEDVQVRQQHPLGFFLLVFFRSGLKLLKGYQMWGGGGGGFVTARSYVHRRVYVTPVKDTQHLRPIHGSWSPIWTTPTPKPSIAPVGLLRYNFKEWSLGATGATVDGQDVDGRTNQMHHGTIGTAGLPSIKSH